MARIRPQHRYARNDSPLRQIILHGRAGLRRDLNAALRHLKDVFNRQRALHLFVHGHGAAAIAREAINWGHYREVLKAVFDRWAKLFEAAAALGTRKINGSHYQRRRRVRFKKLVGRAGPVEGWFDGGSDGNERFAKAIGDRFNFDRFDEDTQATLREAQDDLIAQITTEARDTIETAIMNGQRLGLTPADIIDDIWSVIGLTDTQAQAVLNYENMLRTLDSTALQRQLRDDDFDSAFRRAVENDEPLSEGVIAEMVDAYENNYYDYRAMSIARTESNRAGHQGLHDSYRQAVDRGALPEEAIRREWQLGDNPCPICESISDSNPEGVGVNEDFDSDEGPVDNPPVHPSCECQVDYVTDLSLVPEEDEEEEE